VRVCLYVFLCSSVCGLHHAFPPPVPPASTRPHILAIPMASAVTPPRQLAPTVGLVAALAGHSSGRGILHRLWRAPGLHRLHHHHCGMLVDFCEARGLDITIAPARSHTAVRDEPTLARSHLGPACKQRWDKAYLGWTSTSPGPTSVRPTHS
jgi:hypothetical protein